MPESGTYGSVRGVQGNLTLLPRSLGIQDAFGSFGVHQKNSPAGARPGRVAVNHMTQTARPRQGEFKSEPPAP
jgi:hypothetical protein